MECNTKREKVAIVHQKLFTDRERTNILRGGEQKLILFLLKKVPDWVTPNFMTGIGMLGSVVVFVAFILAHYYGNTYLLIGIGGLLINWLGDSLDGRLAYYRHIPRKWYGFTLDIVMDWLSIVLIGLGYYIYASPPYKVLAFLFVVLYGWSMIIALLRYKITGNYRIDTGHLGPTELRVIISLILLAESLIPGIIGYFAIAICALLLIINTVDTQKLLKEGDARDNTEPKR
ncbi:CDP-alcohol phosphatidyltransferase family protein [Pedobacter soli]|uniref:Phosphatidylglycerophosphate synthase n=1 Tax=Pedobacter soli TaxID=390242 RepID=A0A1G6XZN0_9SPHI|nr:CDP-alcohol phosphatidyltransferase family protein [Pedobacter soli]SDD83684.1 Phosphatidylglycerophosphate synthase [Pedobacter soli]